MNYEVRHHHVESTVGKGKLPSVTFFHRHAVPDPSIAAFSRTEPARLRSEEHTSELQSRSDLVCRLLLEKKSIPKDREVFRRVVLQFECSKVRVASDVLA